MKFLKILLLIAPIVVDFYGGIPSFGILADAVTHEGNNRLLYEGMCVFDLQCGTACLNDAVLTGPGFEPRPISCKT